MGYASYLEDIRDRANAALCGISRVDDTLEAEKDAKKLLGQAETLRGHLRSAKGEVAYMSGKLRELLDIATDPELDIAFALHQAEEAQGVLRKKERELRQKVKQLQSALHASNAELKSQRKARNQAESTLLALTERHPELATSVYLSISQMDRDKPKDVR